MSAKQTVSPELKLKAVKEYLEGKGSCQSIPLRYGVPRSSFYSWLTRYRAFGEDAFLSTNKEISFHFTSELKLQAIHAYLSGHYPLHEIMVKFQIRNPNTVKQWVISYNDHNTLRSYVTEGASRMKHTPARQTSFEERLDMVRYFMDHNCTYAQVAEKFQVSYNQIYYWVSSYKEKGNDGLLDKRGRPKMKSPEHMSNTDKMKLELKHLKEVNRRLELENELLKKVKELERRRF